MAADSTAAGARNAGHLGELLQKRGDLQLLLTDVLRRLAVMHPEGYPNQMQYQRALRRRRQRVAWLERRLRAIDRLIKWHHVRQGPPPAA